jgi:hypothetical protein
MAPSGERDKSARSSTNSAGGMVTATAENRAETPANSLRRPIGAGNRDDAFTRRLDGRLLLGIGLAAPVGRSHDECETICEHRLRTPHGGRRLKEAHGRVCLVAVREADEVVERDQARVVVAVLEAERFGERVQQEDLAGAAAADEEQRVLRDERGGRMLNMLGLVFPRRESNAALRPWRRQHELPDGVENHLELLVVFRFGRMDGISGAGHAPAPARRPRARP